MHTSAAKHEVLGSAITHNDTNHHDGESICITKGKLSVLADGMTFDPWADFGTEIVTEMRLMSSNQTGITEVSDLLLLPSEIFLWRT